MYRKKNFNSIQVFPSKKFQEENNNFKLLNFIAQKQIYFQHFLHKRLKGPFSHKKKCWFKQVQILLFQLYTDTHF